MLNLLTICFTIISMAAMVLPIVPSKYWLFRIFDYPRLQICGLHLISITLLLITYGVRFLPVVLVVILTLNLLHHIRWIFPYSSLAKQEIPDYQSTDISLAELSIFIWNVLQDNRESKAFLDCVRRYHPDLLFLCETDQWWCKTLKTLSDNYPYRVEIPMDNTYGMCLLSRFPLTQVEQNFLVDEDIPSIYALLKHPNQVDIALHAVHPAPPVPEYAETTEKRNRELFLIAKRIAESSYPTLVFGDFNDVAWSRANKKFQQISGLLDLRKGRAIYATFPAYSSLLRVPIDQIFTTADFRLKKMQLLGAMGSDHFPLYLDLVLVQNEAAMHSEAPTKFL
ncbi:MAG: endonuclease [Bacteroidetes bacterium]|nr:MAG: endonuclease [Bacteroidota bacterium]